MENQPQRPSEALFPFLNCYQGSIGENLRRRRAFGYEAEFAVEKIEALAIDVGWLSSIKR